MLLRRTLLIGALTFFMIGALLPSSNFLTLSSIPKAHGVSHSIKLTGASYTGWNGTNPGPTITVAMGDSVSLALVSGDGAPHTFIIDVDKDGVVASPNCSLDKCSPQFASSTTYPFTVDFGPGTYTYYCSIHLNMMVGTFIVPMPDYGVSSNPSSLSISSGSSGVSTISVTGSNGFSGTVSLTASAPSGLAVVAPSPTSVTLSPTATSATSTLTISSALGRFNVTVTATSGSTSHSMEVLVNGPDFDITTNSATASVNQGSTTSLMVTIASMNGFSGSVVMSASSSPSGLPVTISPTTLQVPSSGSVSATLTATASSSGAYSTPVASGNYIVTLNATMGSLSHTKTIPITVTSSSSGTGILTSPIVIGGIIAAVVVVAIAVYALRGRPRK